MNKVSLIIKREYITRVSNKRFLLMTFLMPVIFILFIGGSAYFAATSKEQSNIAVVDDPGFLKANLKSDTGNVVFHFVGDIDTSNYQEKYDAVLYAKLNNGSIDAELHSLEQMGFETTNFIERQLNESLENKLLLENGIEKKVLDSISNRVEENVILKNLVEESEGKSKEANTGLAYGIGFGSGFLIYLTMFIFGAMVMRGVAEEKTNRIAEVIVSSCKPFELMLGKIVGIAGVGLTQLLLWIGLMALISSSLTAFIPAESLQQFQQIQEGGQMSIPTTAGNPAALKILKAKEAITEGANWMLIIGCFIFYFLGGYLFYAALFAAIGSVINEDPQEAQQLMMPISMPILFAFIILQSVLANPGTPLAVWTSIIPFTSPIIMMGRIPFGVPNTVPYWQLAASMLSLIGGFIFTTWFAGKIYRTGILLYGKKVTWKEMLKWSFRKS